MKKTKGHEGPIKILIDPRHRLETKSKDRARQTAFISRDIQRGPNSPEGVLGAASPTLAVPSTTTSKLMLPLLFKRSGTSSNVILHSFIPSFVGWLDGSSSFHHRACICFDRYFATFLAFFKKDREMEKATKSPTDPPEISCIPMLGNAIKISKVKSSWAEFTTTVRASGSALATASMQTTTVTAMATATLVERGFSHVHAGLEGLCLFQVPLRDGCPHKMILWKKCRKNGRQERSSTHPCSSFARFLKQRTKFNAGSFLSNSSPKKKQKNTPHGFFSTFESMEEG